VTGAVFFDTSVLVSGLASVGPPSDHSRRLLVAVAQDRIARRATAWHCCLEFYSVVTRLPEEYRLTPALALDLLQTQILARFEVHSLPEARRAELVDNLSREGIAGGRIYDLHIAEIARTSGAGTIVTNNRRHFTSLLRYGIRVLTAAELVEEMEA
jgi:predicted nucleic acid-binding protein